MTQGPGVATDTLRAIIDSVLRDPAYQTRAPRDAWAPVRRTWNALLDWVDRLHATSPVAYRAFVWLLVAILAAIVLHAMWIAARTIRAGTAAPDRPMPQAASMPRDAGWYADEARRLAAAGRYAEAMQADFLRLVLELDARKITRFHPSKTPFEYVRDAALTTNARHDFRALVTTLYTHAFARVSVTDDAWHQWRAAAHADRYAAAL